MLQRRREIGIRMALGAPPRDLAGLVTARNFLMVLAGAAAGLGPGIVSDHYLQPLLFRVRSTELPTLITPALAIFGAS